MLHRQQLQDTFLQVLTLRKILFLWDGSDWVPIAWEQTTGQKIYFYIDYTNGTDSIEKGDGQGTDAIKTIEYALSLCPIGCAFDFALSREIHTVSNQVTFNNVIARLYSDGISSAAITVTSAGAGFATVSGAGWTTDEHVGKQYSEGGVKMVITSNTSDTLYFPSALVATTGSRNIDTIARIDVSSSPNAIFRAEGGSLYLQDIYIDSR